MCDLIWCGSIDRRQKDMCSKEINWTSTCSKYVDFHANVHDVGDLCHGHLMSTVVFTYSPPTLTGAGHQ